MNYTIDGKKYPICLLPNRKEWDSMSIDELRKEYLEYKKTLHHPSNCGTDRNNLSASWMATLVEYAKNRNTAG